MYNGGAMELSDIKAFARTARIEVSDEEASQLLQDLVATVSYIEQVAKAPLPEEVVTVGDRYNATREDTVTNPSGACTDALFAQAPAVQDGYLKVKKIL
jgi:aspartyl/glutamyl-tRNA(Asn/Gln) amidotransferase C subunit